MASGWKFSVTLPSWTQATLEADELVVFYRVEVKVLPPRGSGAPKTRTVLRRYNHFVKLYSKLCVELGQPKMAGKDPPSKRSLLNINRRPELIERRKKELQQWLWRLVSDPEIAKAKALNEFLELSDAARFVQRPSAIGSASEPPESIADGSYGMSEGSSPRGDASSEISGYTAASQMTDRGSLMTDFGTPLRSQQPTAEFAADSPEVGARARLRMSSAASSLLESVLEGEENHKRLGLRIQQRGNIRRVVKELKHMLDTASSDLQDAVEALSSERQAKRQLAETVASLELRVNSDHTQREAELERLLQQVAEIDSLIGRPALWQERAASRSFEEALGTATSKNETLVADLEVLQKEASARASADAPVYTEDEKVRAVEEVAAALALEHKEEVGRLLQQQAETQERSDAAEANAQLANDRVAAANEESRAALEALDSAKSKSKADMKLLAKEVKSLRKQLAESAERAEKAESEAAAAVAQVRAEKARAEAEDLTEQLTAANSRAKLAEAAVAAAAARAETADTHLTAREAEWKRSLDEAVSKADAAAAQLASAELQIREEHAAALERAVVDAAARAEANSISAIEQARAENKTQLSAAEERVSEAEARLGSVEAQLQQASAAAEVRYRSAAETAAADLDRVRAEGAAQLRSAEERLVESEAILGSLFEQQAKDAGLRAETESKLEEVRQRAVRELENLEASHSKRLLEAKTRAEEAASRAAAALAAAQSRESALEAQLRDLKAEAQAREDRRSAVLEKQGSGQDIAQQGEPAASLVSETNGRPAALAGAAETVLDLEHEAEGSDREHSTPKQLEVARADSATSVLSELSEKPSAERQLGMARSLETAEPPQIPETSANQEPGEQAVDLTTLPGHKALPQDQAKPEGTPYLTAHMNVDPFASSGGLDLFSGLGISDEQTPAQPDSLSKGQPDKFSERTQEHLLATEGGPGVRDVTAADNGVKRIESAGGLDLLGMEDDMLAEAVLQFPGGSDQGLALEHGRSTGLLSWSSDASHVSDLLGIEADAQHPKSGAFEKSLDLSSVPEERAAHSGAEPPSTAELLTAEQTQSLRASDGSEQARRQPDGGKALVSQPRPSETAEQREQRQPADDSQPAGLFGRFMGPASAQPSGQQAVSNTSPPRGMGGFMNRMGLGAQPPNPTAPQGSDAPSRAAIPPASAGLQAMWGGRDRIESLARGFMRKSGSKPEG